MHKRNDQVTVIYGFFGLPKQECASRVHRPTMSRCSNEFLFPTVENGIRLRLIKKKDGNSPLPRSPQSGLPDARVPHKLPGG